jgi:branched-subunit amino acid ABC-type transport system permease component
MPSRRLLPTGGRDIGGAHITDVQIVIICSPWLIMAGLMLLVNRTRLGRAMRATAENPQIAGLMGVNQRIISATFLIGSALAAVAGVMVSANYGIAHYHMGFMLGLKAFTAAVLGGIGNLPGAMLGGVLLGLIESLGAGYIGDLTGGFLGSHYQDVFAFFVLISCWSSALRTDGRTRGGAGVSSPPCMKGDAQLANSSPPCPAGHACCHLGAWLISLVNSAVLPFLVGQGLGNAWVRVLDFALLYVMLALGLNIVVGFAGLLDLGYIAFYAVGAYLYALLASPHFGLHWPFWAILPLGALVAGAVRRAARRADAAPARRLPRHRHARLRRDRAHLHEQPQRAGEHHQRPAGHQPDRPGAHRRHAAVEDARDRRPDAFPPSISTTTCSWRWSARRLRLASACRIRASAAPGWRSARTRSPPRPAASTRATSSCSPSPWAPPSAASPAAVRRLPGIRQPGELQPDGVDHGAVHGGARRHGPHSRRHPRRPAADACCPRPCATAPCRCSRRLFGTCCSIPKSLRMLLFGLALIAVMLYRRPACGRAARIALSSSPSGEAVSDLLLEARRSASASAACGAARRLADHPPRRDLRPDRPQRRRQDHLLQRAHRALHAPTAASSSSTARRCRGKPHEVAPPASRAPSRTSACSPT